MPTLDVAINALRAKHGAKQFDQAAAKIKRAAKGVDKSVDKTEKKLGFLGDRYKSVAKAALGMAVTYGTIRFLKSAIQEMAQYEVGLANVSTMLDDTTMKYLPKYGRELDKMAIEYGEATGTLSKGLYDILSASIDAAEALDVLDVSARAATAGLTDTGKAADILTTIINAYGMSASQAEEISDILFATVKRGKTTFDELASSMGMIVSLAATAGLSIEEVGAALATMTRAGISTDMAVTSLKGILTTFLSPTRQNTVAAKKLGLELNSNTLNTIGLTGAVRKLDGATAEQIASIFTNVRALTGLSALLQMSSSYMYDLGETTNATGKMMDAFGKQIGTTQYKLDQMNEAIKSMKRAVGEQLSPAIQTWTQGVVGLIPELKELGGTLADLLIAPELLRIEFDKLFGRWKYGIAVGLLFKEKMKMGKKEVEGVNAYQLALAGIGTELGAVDKATLKANPDLAALDKIINDFVDSTARAEAGLAKFTKAEKEAGEEAKKTAEELKILAEVKLAAQFKAFEEGMKGNLYAANDLERGLLALREAAHAMEKELEDFIPPSEKYLAALEKMTDATNKIQTEIEYFGMTNIEKQLTQFEQLGESLKGEELESFISQLAKLREEYKKLAELEAEEERVAETVKLRKKETEAIDDAREKAQGLIREIQLEQEILYLTNEERERAIKLQELEATTKGLGAVESERLKEAYIAELEELSRMREMKVLVDNVRAGVGDLIRAPLTALLDETRDMGDVLEDTLRDIGTDVLKTLYEETITKPLQDVLMKSLTEMMDPLTDMLSNLLTGIVGGATKGIGAMIGGFFMGEKGLVLKNGKITAFGKGDVINRPTIFPMANGMGIMAEKKPEAVMPLARDESGRLGVRAEGGGGTTVIKMMNILDESLFEDYLSTGAGERAVVNIMRRNQEAFREVTL